MVGGMSPTHAAGSNSVALHGEEGGGNNNIVYFGVYMGQTRVEGIIDLL